MQSIINSIIKYRNLIIYIFLLLFSFNYLYNNSGLHYSSLGNISISISGFSAKQINNVKSYFNLISENKLLKEENLILQKNQFNSYSNNVESESLMPNIIQANVIKNTINKTRNFILIDKGENDGVLSTIGSLSWDGDNPSKMILSDIPSSNQIKLGDTIITGGMSFYFPKGIKIGTISNYETNETEGYFNIEVSLFNNFSSLNNVYILDKLDNEQINKLINN